NGSGIGSYDDLGIEVSEPDSRGEWRHCWLRADYAGRYTRFIHIRHVRTMDEIALLFTGCTCLPWEPINHFFGVAYDQRRADQQRKEQDRFDRRIARDADGSATAWTSDI